MKKALAEVISKPATSELEARIAVLEARLEKLDPSPKREKLEPYLVGSSVYSVADAEARYPLVVTGYRAGRILVAVSPDEPPRELHLASVRPLEQCPRAQPTPDQISEQMYGHMDPKTRAYHEGRRKAELEAKTSPFVQPIQEQKRYG